MVSLWDVASLTMIAFWPHLVVDDFLLLTSSNIQTPGTSKYVEAFVSLLSFFSKSNEKTKKKYFHKFMN